MDKHRTATDSRSLDTAIVALMAGLAAVGLLLAILGSVQYFGPDTSHSRAEPSAPARAIAAPNPFPR